MRVINGLSPRGDRPADKWFSDGNFEIIFLVHTIKSVCKHARRKQKKKQKVSPGFVRTYIYSLTGLQLRIMLYVHAC